MLTQEQLAEYDALLAERLLDNEAQLDAITGESEPVSTDLPIGRLTRQDALQSQHMAVHLKERLQQQRTRIEAARKRIEQGTFGVCVMCKQPIPPERLQIVPEAPICVACQDKRSAG